MKTEKKTSEKTAKKTAKKAAPATPTAPQADKIDEYDLPEGEKDRSVPTDPMPARRRKEKETIERLEKARRFGEHRLLLLNEVPEFQKDLEELKTYITGFADGFNGSKTVGVGFKAVVYSRSEVTGFEEKWSVQIDFGETGRGKATDFTWVDTYYPNSVEQMSKDNIERIARLIKRFPRRFLVVDSQLSGKEINESLDTFLPEKSSGYLKYEFQLEPGQDAEDAILVREMLKGDASFEQVVKEVDPRLAREGHWEDEFENKVRSLNNRWKKLEAVLAPVKKEKVRKM